MPPRPESAAHDAASKGSLRVARSRAPRRDVAGSRAACFVAAAAMVFGSLAGPAPAHAQVGLGAERYEVTITPPKRPGSEAAADEAAAPSAGAVPEPESAPVPNDVLGGEGAPAQTEPAAAAPDARPAAVPPAAAASATARVDPNLPRRTLQVGAYRQRKSAQSMHDELTAAFQDVTVVEVQSGGEALYRVNVGRLPRGAALEDLRRRLVAAGYPAFEVAAPTLPAAD